MSKFHVIWKDEDGSDHKEVFNSYYLATVRKGKLAGEGHSADIIEKGSVGSGVTDASVSFSQAEKEMLRKLKGETSDKIREGNKKVYARRKGEPLSREGLGRARRARAFKMINKGGLR